MRCPYCGHHDLKVVDSRDSEIGEAIRRRRECLACGKRFTTYERIEAVPFYAAKHAGRRADIFPPKHYTWLGQASPETGITTSRAPARSVRVYCAVRRTGT